MRRQRRSHGPIAVPIFTAGHGAPAHSSSCADTKMAPVADCSAHPHCWPRGLPLSRHPRSACPSLVVRTVIIAAVANGRPTVANGRGLLGKQLPCAFSGSAQIPFHIAPELLVGRHL